MLDERKVTRKPAKDVKKPPRVRYHILTGIPQEQELKTEETLEVWQDEEVPGPAEKQVTGAEIRRPGTPADSSLVPRPDIQLVIKGAMKSALQPPKPSLQKPARRPEILPASPRPDEPGPQERGDLPQGDSAKEKTDDTQIRDTLAENPPFCKNCGKKVPPAANFCPMCGITLGGSPPPPVPGRPPGRKTIQKEPAVTRKKGTPLKKIRKP